MTWFLVKLLIRVVVFGVAIGYVLRSSERVTVQPKKALPLVALVFALLNAALYPVLKFGINLVTLWSLFFLVPFVANALLLLGTSRLIGKLKKVKFEIDGIFPYAYAAAIVTVGHIVLRIAHL